MVSALLQIIALLMLASTPCNGKETLTALPFDKQSNMFLYQGIDTIRGVNADELQQRARSWIATVYNSAQHVIQLDDKDAHRIIIKGSFGVEWLSDIAQIHHTLTFEFKDDRFRYTMTEFRFQGKSWSEPLALEGYRDMKWGWDKVLSRTAVRSESIIQDLKTALKQPSPIGSDNW
jgi:hypothetical protein